MPEKTQDRLYRLTCSAYGVTKRVMDVIEALTDEQLCEVFDDILADALQSGDIKQGGR